MLSGSAKVVDWLYVSKHQKDLSLQSLNNIFYMEINYLIGRFTESISSQCSIRTPLKDQKLYVFRGYKIEILDWNGLNSLAWYIKNVNF